MPQGMKAGRIARIRINPRDCMSIVDMLDAAGLYQPNMSFAHAVSIALGSALETFRQHEVIPTRDGFEYLERMARFPDTTTGRKVTQFKLLKKDLAQGPAKLYAPQFVPDASPDMGSEPAPMTEAQLLNHPNHEVRTTYMRLKELTFKRSADVSSFSDEDALELDTLENKLGHLL